MTGPFNIDGGVHQIPLPDVPGRLHVCGKHVVAPNPDEVMGRLGADVVVCLVEQPELAHRYDGYVDWLRVEAGRRAEWWPIPDLSYPAVEHMTDRLGTLASRLSDGAGVIIHCGAGIGRAGTTAVALLMLLGTPIDDALASVRTHRPGAGPEAGSQRSFIEALHARLHD